MMHNATQTLRALLLGLSFFTLAAAAQAQTTNVWTGPAVGDWSDPANWSLGEVPQAASSPPDPLDVSVLLDTNLGQDSSVLLEGNFGVGSLAIDAGDALTIAEGATLTVGPVLNSGSIRVVGDVNGPFTPRGLRTSGTVVNAPGSLLTLDKVIFSALSSGGNAPLFWNQSTTEGSGIISDLSLQNDGLINANIPSGESLETLAILGNINSSETAFLHNSGTMQASNGGILRLGEWRARGILNQGNGQAGTIEAWGDSTVVIENADITGGRITTSTEGGVEEGQILFSGQISLHEVELDAAASFALSGADHLLLNSTFANKKTLTLTRSTLRILGTNVLSGGGVFKIGQGASIVGAGFGQGGVDRFVNVDNTLLVSQFSTARLDGMLLAFENQGTLEANGPGANLQLASMGPAWTNTGVIRAVNGGRVAFNQASDEFFENTGGVLEVDGNSSLSFGNTRIRGGTLRAPTSPDPQMTDGFGFIGNATLKEVRLEGDVRWQGDLALVGNLENTGTLSSLQFLTLASEEVTLTGGGELSFFHVEGSGEFNFTPKLINVDNTLRVNDHTEFFGVHFTNRGTVEANGQGVFSQLSFASNSSTSPRLVVNSGVIRAIDGASLGIGDDLLPIQNYEIDELGNVVAGKIQAGVNSEVRVVSVSGGIVQAAASGVIRVAHLGYLGALSAPTDLQLLGRIETERLSLDGTIRNDGQLVVSGDINAGNNPASPPLRLLGNGELQLDGALLTRNSTFLNGPDHTIVGRGEIRSEGSFFTNEGSIEANDNNTLTLTHTGPAFLFQQRGELVSSGNGTLKIEFEGLFTNYGTVRVAAGAQTTFDGDFSNSGNQLVNASGAILDVEGRLVVAQANLINEMGGTVISHHLIDLSSGSSEQHRFTNHGTLALGDEGGDSVGRSKLFGHYEQSTTGDLEIELGGTALHEYDSLSARSADLAGLLEVSLVDVGDGEFAPELGDSFSILELGNGSVTGEFDRFSLPTLATGLLWGIQYNSSSVVLEILAPLQADLDQDGDVDGSDFLALQRNDPSLISQWQTEYGSRVIIISPAVLKAVPEPTSCVLCLTALLGCCLSRRRRSDG